MNAARGEILATTRVGALLDAYPELEAELLDISPAFAKLKNPILRKTVAKVATLRMAAEMAGVPVGELVNRLRRAAGQGETTVESAAPIDDDATWIADVRLVHRFDAEEMLSRGEHPLEPAIDRAASLQAGEAIVVASPFRPDPLIDAFRKKGYRTTCRQVDASAFETWITPVGTTHGS
ncbi:MAG: DUF1858 domain-containing protein [Deltaproteobacteria bacterium]|nr:DUF1858 domain-containing protein [Deltaproteobacteria bacterium]